jgi:hypothetical protein
MRKQRTQSQIGQHKNKQTKGCSRSAKVGASESDQIPLRGVALQEG